MANNVTLDDINQFQSGFWTAGNVADVSAKLCKDEPQTVIDIARDLSDWASRWFSSETINFKKAQGVLDLSSQAFSFVHLIPGLKDLIDSIGEGFQKIKDYFGQTASIQEPAVTGSDLAHSFAEVTGNGAGLISDGCDSLKFLHEAKVVDFSEQLSTIKGVGSSATIIAALKGLYDNASGLWQSWSQPEEAHSEIEHQIADFKEKNQWAGIVLNTAIFGIGFFALLSVVAAVAVSSTLMLTLSSVALIASVASYFIKENAHQMQQNLMGRVVHQL